MTAGSFLLSPQQRRRWTLTTRRLISTCQCTLRLTGDFSEPAVRTALTATVSRHEILRTTFVWTPGFSTPLQSIQDALAVDWRVVTAHQASPGDASARAATSELNETQLSERRPFDLERGPILRACLLRYDAQTNDLILTLPATHADSTTLMLLVAELAQHLEACPFRTNVANPPPYVKFAAWLNQLCQEHRSGPANRDEPRASADHVRPAERLPFQIPQPASAEGLRYQGRSIVPNLATRIRSSAETLAVPVPVFVLTCWKVLLWKLTNQSWTIQCATEGRCFDELAKCVGPFVHYRSMACDLSDGVAFSSLATRIAALRRERSEVPQLDFPPVDSTTAEAPFDVGFAYEERPAETRIGDGSIAIIDWFVHDEATKLQLALGCAGTTWRTELRHAPALFDDSGVESLLRQLHALLDQAASTPHAAIGHLSTWDPADRARLVVQANATSPLGPDDCWHQLFEQRASLTPGATALVCNDQALTYRELDGRANQVAHFLHGRGAGPGALVGLFLDRSLELFVCMLGVLKIGAAFVPIDLELPTARLVTILKQLGGAIVLTMEPLRARLPDEDATVVCLDGLSDELRRMPTHGTGSDPIPSGVAYVIFTSGSTGTPNGVCVEQRQIAHYSRALLDRVRPRRGSKFAMVSSFSTDLAYTSVFPALLGGHQLHVLSSRQATDPELLARHFVRTAIDCLNIAPSHLSALLRSDWGKDLLPRRCLILGGESVPWSLVEQVRGLVPACQILIHYGPTETTVGVLTHAIADDEVPVTTMVPLGRPVPGVRAYVVDPLGNPQPPGVAGELLIGGANVARCYLGRPALTAERFVPDFFEALPRTRLYRSGDRARWLPDGRLEFLGRVDHQIKLHGHRIELRDIEHSLLRHPEIDACAVVLSSGGTDENRQLIAHLRLKAGTAFEASTSAAEALRAWLLERLPRHMLPHRFIVHERFPLLPNGKLDRMALEGIECSDAVPSRSAPPRTDEERALAEIWRAALRLEEVGIHDNFFALGGDSLRSIQIVGAARARGLRLTPQQLFQHQTIAELARVAERVGEAPLEAPACGRTGALTPLQCWFFERRRDCPHRVSDFVWLEIGVELDASLLERAIAFCVDHHSALRLRFLHGEGGWTQRLAPAGGGASFSRLELGTLDPNALHRAAEDQQTLLDLAEGPLVKFVLASCPDAYGQLLVVWHYLVADALSISILLEDVIAVYQQLSQQRPARLPAENPSFSEWSERLVRCRNLPEILAQREFWVAQMRPAHESLRVDFPDQSDANTESSSETLSVLFTAEETHALTRGSLARSYGGIDDVLLAALAYGLLDGTPGQLTVDVERRGRGGELVGQAPSRSVGRFTRRFPVRLQVPTGGDPAQILSAVRGVLTRVPLDGVAYGLLAYPTEQRGARAFAERLDPEVYFNNLGDLEVSHVSSAVLRLSPDALRRDILYVGYRPYVLTILASIREQRLELRWTYSANLHRRDTIERWASAFASMLRRLVAQQPTAQQSPEPTPAEAATTDLSHDEVDDLLNRYGSYTGAP